MEAKSLKAIKFEEKVVVVLLVSLKRRFNCNLISAIGCQKSEGLNKNKEPTKVVTNTRTFFLISKPCFLYLYKALLIAKPKGKIKKGSLFLSSSQLQKQLKKR